MRRSTAKTMTMTLVAAAVIMALTARITPRMAEAGEVIKIGTVAPKSSPWGHVFDTWAKAVKEKSSGRLELQFVYNGAAGDEAAMVGKIKNGQLDGAAVSAVGLSKIYKP